MNIFHNINRIFYAILQGKQYMLKDRKGASSCFLKEEV